MKKLLVISVSLNVIAIFLLFLLNSMPFMEQKNLTLHSDDNAFIIKDLQVIKTNKYVYISEPRKYIVNNEDVKNVYFSVIDSTGKELYNETQNIDYDTKKNNDLHSTSGEILPYKKNIKFKIGYQTDKNDYHHTIIELD